MAVKLYDYQKEAVENLRTGSILCGGVGSGKSITSLYYYFVKECEGEINGIDIIPMKRPKKLYIITTARKRDTLEWDKECLNFYIIESDFIIDSWNNIHKYIGVKDSFFIFDEQRVIGSGVWVKSFLKIAKQNNWILLSATPGDSWSDYIPVFIANGFYKNRTEFLMEHVVFSRFTKYQKIERYIGISRLVKYRNKILVNMRYSKKTISHDKVLFADYDKTLTDTVLVQRWNPFDNLPVIDIREVCYLLRRIANSDESRLTLLKDILKQHNKLVLFYSFNYELDIISNFAYTNNIKMTQWNGHKHEEIPNGDLWIYVIQYTAGAEGWNCIETNTVVFYSQTYSYKTLVQSAGRIDRLNTPYTDLYYYHIKSKSPIDLAIQQSLNRKQNFNETNFIK